MQSQKIDNLLHLAVDATEREREKSLNLNVGYEPDGRRWEVIVKYTGDLFDLLAEGIGVVPLLNEYAVLTVPQNRLEDLAARPEIEYIEKPKRLFFAVRQGLEASCIVPVQGERFGLLGEGVLVGIVDSGIDWRHPDFRKEDGTTRILRLWDQTISGRPPQGYLSGTEYTEAEINAALSQPKEEGNRLVPSFDAGGHGTAVAGIAAGNGAASGGINRGVAPHSFLAVVKLGLPKEASFPRTTELMQGVDYLLRLALRTGLPLALNLSFGNNYGSHQGDSLLETYLDDAANFGRTVLVTGTGNNAREALHAAGRLRQGERRIVEFGVSNYEPALNLQIWKSYADTIDIYLRHPSGERFGPLGKKAGTARVRIGETELLLYYGEPSPYSLHQEIYLDFLPQKSYIDPGVWAVELYGQRVTDGEYRMWLPGGNVLNPATGFYQPSVNGTLTIPSTAKRILSVAAYDSRARTYADFSGRGLSGGRLPDLAAPGVGILTTRAGGGYAAVTGTSFAAPFVTGSAALLMEWGIVRGNDPYLYGEKVKAYLRRGARPLAGFTEYPNPEIGYGTLCLADSFPK